MLCMQRSLKARSHCEIGVVLKSVFSVSIFTYRFWPGTWSALERLLGRLGAIFVCLRLRMTAFVLPVASAFFCERHIKLVINDDPAN